MIWAVMTAIPRTEHAVARSLAETADPRDAVARALRAIGESLDWAWGAVWEPATEEPEALTCVEVWEAAGTDAGALAALSRAVTLSSGVGLPGRVWEQRRARVDRRRHRRRQLPSRPSRARGGAARGVLLPGPQCPRGARA